MSLSKKSNPYSCFINQQSAGVALGITREEVKEIVHTFYAKVRCDPMLGPVFADGMTENWEDHLQKMSDFWTTVMFAEPLYKGNPMEAHVRIKQLSKEHFVHWLSLFKDALQEVCVDSSHIDAFSGRAQNMARALIIAKDFSTSQT